MRHPEREAVARCLSCNGTFCRECVVEHDGQLICSSCLAQKAASEKRTQGEQRGRRIRNLATMIGAGFVLWFAFYELGSLLLKIPPDLHDGTLWKRLERGSGERS